MANYVMIHMHRIFIFRPTNPNVEKAKPQQPPPLQQVILRMIEPWRINF